MWQRETPKPTFEELEKLAIEYNRLTQKRAEVYQVLDAKFRASERSKLVVFDDINDAVIKVRYMYERNDYSAPHRIMKVTQETFTRK